jgi:Cu(I)/Ag(I) efflux system membrane fusion protein
VSEALHEGEEAPPRGVRAMGIVRWVLVIAAAAAATFSIVHVTRDDSAAHAGVWYCPMHPHVVQDHPGECPICHMSLVKREPSEAPAGGEHAGHDMGGGDGTLVPVDLTDDRIQHMGLLTEEVTRRKLGANLRALATVGASETGWAQVTPRFAGWLERVHVTETGRRVKRGQALATLYSPDLLAAQEEYLAALGFTAAPSLPTLPHGHTDAAPAVRDLASDARRRLELFGMSGADIDTITRTRTPMRTVTLRAPIAGAVLSRGAVEGAYVQPGAALFEIADLSTVWAWIEIPERELGRVAVGQPATLEVTAFPGEAFTGKVAFLAPVVDPTTRTLRARIELSNKNGRLRPGMSGQAAIALPDVEVLAVPEQAVIDTGEAQYVFVAGEKGRFEPRRVSLGRRVEGWAELLPDAQVKEHERVVTTGNFLLDAESRLQARIGGGP